MSSSDSQAPPDDAAPGLRVLVVDDEELACRGLRRKLLALGARDVTTLTDPAEAVVTLRDAPPDVVFLDVQMPGLSGFDVLAQFPEPSRPFAAIFCTAFDNHAMRAFDAAALDYLVKPVDPARLAAALARARRFLASAPRAPRYELTRARDAGLAGFLARLVVRSRAGAHIVDVADIEAIASEAHRAVAYTAHDEHVLEPSLASLEPQLDPAVFVRAHRAHIVNLAHVTGVDGETVSLASGRTVALSRRNRTALLVSLEAFGRFRDRGPGPANSV